MCSSTAWINLTRQARSRGSRISGRSMIFGSVMDVVPSWFHSITAIFAHSLVHVLYKNSDSRRRLSVFLPSDIGISHSFDRSARYRLVFLAGFFARMPVQVLSPA